LRQSRGSSAVCVGLLERRFDAGEAAAGSIVDHGRHGQAGGAFRQSWQGKRGETALAISTVRFSFKHRRASRGPRRAADCWRLITTEFKVNLAIPQPCLFADA
jgi:hypothetical protein